MQIKNLFDNVKSQTGSGNGTGMVIIRTIIRIPYFVQFFFFDAASMIFDFNTYLIFADNLANDDRLIFADIMQSIG